jgi:hypothetical protein
MEILQFWIGQSIPKNLLDCIKSVKKQVKKPNTYTFISDKNYFEKEPMVNFIDYKDFLNEMIKDQQIKNMMDTII